MVRKKINSKEEAYEQRWDDTEEGIENVCVPFFYDFGGSNQNSEKFIQANYTNFTSDECTDIGLQKIDGNFDFFNPFCPINEKSNRLLSTVYHS